MQHSISGKDPRERSSQVRACGALAWRRRPFLAATRLAAAARSLLCLYPISSTLHSASSSFALVPASLSSPSILLPSSSSLLPSLLPASPSLLCFFLPSPVPFTAAIASSQRVWCSRTSLHCSSSSVGPHSMTSCLHGTCAARAMTSPRRSCSSASGHCPRKRASEGARPS